MTLARRGHLAARPQRARIHRVARSAGIAAGSGGAAGGAARGNAPGRQRARRADQSPGCAAGAELRRRARARRPRRREPATERFQRAASAPRPPVVRRRRRLWSRAASRDVVGDRRSAAPRRGLDQSNDDRDLPANPEAFGGNINVLRAGATLRLPESADFDTLATTVANAEVRRQTDEWQNRARRRPVAALAAGRNARSRATPAPAPATARRDRAAARRAAPAPAREPPPLPPPPKRASPARGPQRRAAEPARGAAAAGAEDAPAAEAEVADPGVELESEQLFADETEPAAGARSRSRAGSRRLRPPRATPVATEPSLVSQAHRLVVVAAAVDRLGRSGVAADGALVRAAPAPRGRGRHGPLGGAGIGDRRRSADSRRDGAHAPSGAGGDDRRRGAARGSPASCRRARAAARAACRGAARRNRRAAPADETLSSQTVINLDQADAVAEADFHIAYGLYDQAAELVQKALEAAPDRRDLKLKLLEVYFMWGNKDAFLKAAQSLRADIGQADDPDWNKVVIMGKQICPDERLFTEATAGAGRVDVDLEAGDSPLDLAFDDAASADVAAAATAGLDFDLESSDQRPAPKPAAKPSKPARRAISATTRSTSVRARRRGSRPRCSRTWGRRDDAGRTRPDVAADSLAVTQESPTIERPGAQRLGARSRALRAVRRRGADRRDADDREPGGEVGFDDEDEDPRDPAAQRVADRRAARARRRDERIHGRDRSRRPRARRQGHRRLAGRSRRSADGRRRVRRDTREQPALRDDDALLSATGVTKVLHSDDDDDPTAAQHVGSRRSGRDDAGAGLRRRHEHDDGHRGARGPARGDDESGNTSLVKSLRGKDDDVDLDLADLTAALHGADTVEQPRASSFSRDVFGGGATPLDLDIGKDALRRRRSDRHRGSRRSIRRR